MGSGTRGPVGRVRWAAMVADGMLCLAADSLGWLAARWTVAGRDRLLGGLIPMTSVRFRWRASAETWARNATAAAIAEYGYCPPFEVHRLGAYGLPAVLSDPPKNRPNGDR